MKTPDEIVEIWDAGLKPLKAVHHQVGNFVVNAAVIDYGSHSVFLKS